MSNLDNYVETHNLDDSDDDSDELLEGGDSIQLKVQWKHQVLRIRTKKVRENGAIREVINKLCSLRSF